MNVHIPVNKKRVPYAFLIYLLLAIFFVFNYIYHWDSSSDAGFGDKVLRIIPIAFALVMALLSLADYLKTLFDATASLIISDMGIHDNLSIFSCGHMPWQDIIEAKVVRVSRVEFLIIHLTDKEKYILKKKNIVRLIVKRYANQYGSPIVISPKRIKYDLLQLSELINSRAVYNSGA